MTWRYYGMADSYFFVSRAARSPLAYEYVHVYPCTCIGRTVRRNQSCARASALITCIHAVKDLQYGKYATTRALAGS
jgi:hypothetical protein